MLKMSTQQAVVLKRMAAPLVDGRLTRAVMVHTKRGTRQALREARRCGLTGRKVAVGVSTALVSLQAHGSLFSTTHAEAAAQSLDNGDSFKLLGKSGSVEESGNVIVRLYGRLREAILLIMRMSFLTALGGSVFLPGKMLRVLVNRDIAPDWLVDLWWAYALWAIQVAGPTYVKLAQWAASRPDMFPGDFCTRFKVLHDATTPHAWHHTAVYLNKALGPHWDRQLVLKREVIGSGCIAQVYSGTWFDGPNDKVGTKVAVKVAHPNIHAKVDADMRILQWIAGQVEYWMPETQWLGTSDVISDFEQLMQRQMDLRLESLNLKRFRTNFAKEKDLRVSFPEPLFAERDVLVETFMDGKPIEYFLSDAGLSREMKNKIADVGMEVSLRMVFVHNFIHADLHPGNIMVDFDLSDPKAEPTVICLDAGLAYELTDHKTFLSVVTALMLRDGKKAGKYMIENAESTSTASPEKVAAYCQGVQDIIDSAQNAQFFEQLGTYIYDFFTLAYTHHVKLDHNFVCVAMAVKVMEGLAISLNPELDLINRAVPYVGRASIDEGVQEAVARLGGMLGREAMNDPAAKKKFEELMKQQEEKAAEEMRIKVLQSWGSIPTTPPSDGPAQA